MDKATTSTTTTTTDQTHDFMNVDSFSQLPFIRPTPTTKDKAAAAAAAASGIRLFGIDVSSSSAATENSDSGESTTNATTANHRDPDTTATTAATATGGGAENGESGRKFECHYCCRNFPTSQALGGHQNAHKRERQHAKRAHLQSAMLAADPHHHHHLYGLVNYPSHHHHRPSTNPYYPTPSYTSINRYSYTPTTTTTNTTTATAATSTFSLHPHNHQHPPTINGSPLAMWRIPSAVHGHRGYHHDRSINPLPLFAGSSSASTTIIDASAPKSSIASIMSSSHQDLVGFDNNDQFKRRPATSDQHVSLDLHL